MDLSNDGGVLKEILKEGTGEVPPDGYEIRGMLYEIPFTWLSHIFLSFSDS